VDVVRKRWPFDLKVAIIAKWSDGDKLHGANISILPESPLVLRAGRACVFQRGLLWPIRQANNPLSCLRPYSCPSGVSTGKIGSWQMGNWKAEGNPGSAAVPAASWSSSFNLFTEARQSVNSNSIRRRDAGAPGSAVWRFAFKKAGERGASALNSAPNHG
jgi:hypothetical protein